MEFLSYILFDDKIILPSFSCHTIIYCHFDHITTNFHHVSFNIFHVISPYHCTFTSQPNKPQGVSNSQLSTNFF